MNTATEQLYVDGFGTTNIGTNVSKIALFLVEEVESENGTPVEKRRVDKQLTIPTQNLISFCLYMLQGYAQNKGLLKTANEQMSDNFSAVIQTLKQS